MANQVRCKGLQYKSLQHKLSVTAVLVGPAAVAAAMDVVTTMDAAWEHDCMVRQSVHTG